MFELNDLLTKANIDPAGVIVMRHRPTEPALRKALPWFAVDRPELYNAYQSTHGERVEKSLKRASHLASFFGHEPGQALFVGIYRVNGWKEMTSQAWHALDSSKTLVELGDRAPSDDRRLLFFDLVLTPQLETWKGKLVVEWPPPERQWWRKAERNKMTIAAIHEESILSRAMPSWTEMVLTWAEVQVLPGSWRSAIAQWRGIYFILDRATGKGYVGSAYGAENIMARWDAYGRTGHGGNVELKALDPANFQFSILERVSPDTRSDDVSRLEATWKDRLGTREFGLNRN